MKKILQSVLSALFFLVCLPGAGFSQYYEYNQQSGIGIPFFQLSIAKQFEQDLKHTRLLVVAQFLYDDLTFVRSDTSGFDAEFELLFAVYDQNNRVIDSHVLNKKVNVKNFEETNSREKNILIRDFFIVPPGRYSFLAKASDLNSNKTAQRKVELRIKDFAQKKIAMSDMLIAQEVRFDSTGQVQDMIPAYGNNFNIRAGHFYVYFDLFVKQAPTSAHIRYRMYGKKGENELDTTIVKSLTTPVTPVWLKISRSRFKKSKYTLEISAKTESATVKQNQSFSFFWSDIPHTQEDINLALQQMAYILDPDTLDYYLKADLDTKQAFFKRFWKERDPDPTTARNELKNEYFRRVNYANKYFSVMGQDGWRTDRGRILIKFGPPDDIERHPFEMGTKPYEVWRYYALRKTFVFVDVTGFGDYRLDPSFFDEEYR